jgi:aminopeptidase N
MAPYLFIAAVGTWDVLEDSIVYPNGRRVALEYLVPPGRIEGARIPMTILKESVLWTYDTQEYEYTRDVYRTICMEKSNFGGMENVGNTTIITDAALIDPFTGDRRIEYAHGVIVHEFEHNQCGSEVTMETPFDMWLNEAFTVDVERQFLMSQFDPACVRLDEVDSMRAPLSGPLAIEDGGHMGNIVRDGFNDPDELVDGVTYVKAAEVIRMLRLIIGAETFLCAKNLYFKRHKGGNANTDQFFACFEELSGRDLSMFKREWLYTIGYPQVEASHHFDEAERLLHLELRQTRAGCGGVFHVPVEIAAFNGDGQTIPGTVRTLELTGAQARFTLECAEGPAFLSISRSCSFYGTFRHAGVTREELLNQIRFDTDGFNRVEAMRQLTDIERIKLFRDPDAMVSPEWVAAYRGILNDPAIPVGLRGYLLRIEESSLVREYLPCYRERYAARLRLLKTLAQEMLPDLVRAFQGVDTYRRSEDPKAGIEERRLKALLLRTIVEAGTPAVWKLAEDHFEKAWHISDRIAALNCINMTDSPNRLARLADGYTSWKDHLSAYTAYLQIVSSGIHDDIFGMIATEEQRPEFNIQHPTHNRALYLPMAANNKMLWTDRGIAWLTETVTRLATINENSSIRMLSCYQLVQKMPADMKAKVLDSLRTLKTRIKKDDAPSVHGRIAAYLGE